MSWFIGMDNTVFLSIAFTGLMVALAHAALPTHWLPFVLAGRGQGWTKSKTLTIAAFASLGHVLFTTTLGLLIVFLGIQAKDWMGEAFHFVTAGILIAFGIFYLLRQKSGAGGHSHAHDCCGARNQGIPAKSNKVVVVGLLTMLTFSPCEGFLPVYLSGLQFGWTGFIVLSLVLAAGTVAGMLFFTWVTLTGLRHVHLHTLEKYESGILGSLLIALGLLVVLVEG